MSTSPDPARDPQHLSHMNDSGPWVWPAWLFMVIVAATVVVFCGGIAWFGAPTSWRALVTGERFGTAWNPPIPAVVKPLIVLCAGLMVVLAIRNFLQRPKGANPADSGTL